MTKLYTTKEARDITDESRQRFDYWILKGVFQPADPGKGTGSSRKYTKRNMLEIMLVKKLSCIMPNINFVVRVFREIEENYAGYFDDLAEASSSIGRNILTLFLPTDLSLVIYIHDLNEATKTMRKWVSKGQIHHVDLDALKQDLEARMKDA